jgi:outer membrane receptor protein involved in Fe transport
VVNRESWTSTPCSSSTSPCVIAPASVPVYGSDTDADWFKVRGFDAASYLDGNRLFSTGYYVWTPEPFGLESVEVLKGPASILYGEAPPGGVINAISKRPTATRRDW